jgi:hypothetical protein
MLKGEEMHALCTTGPQAGATAYALIPEYLQEFF